MTALYGQQAVRCCLRTLKLLKTKTSAQEEPSPRSSIRRSVLDQCQRSLRSAALSRSIRRPFVQTPTAMATSMSPAIPFASSSLAAPPRRWTYIREAHRGFVRGDELELGKPRVAAGRRLCGPHGVALGVRVRGKHAAVRRGGHSSVETATSAPMRGAGEKIAAHVWRQRDVGCGIGTHEVGRFAQEPKSERAEGVEDLRTSLRSLEETT